MGAGFFNDSEDKRLHAKKYLSYTRNFSFCGIIHVIIEKIKKYNQ